jgi:hypothetical protein
MSIIIQSQPVKNKLNDTSNERRARGMGLATRSKPRASNAKNRSYNEPATLF